MLKKICAQLFLSAMLGVFVLIGSPVSTLGQDELCGGEVIIANGGFELPRVPPNDSTLGTPDSWSGTGAISQIGVTVSNPSQAVRLGGASDSGTISQVVNQDELAGSTVTFTIRALWAGSVTFNGVSKPFAGPGTGWVVSNVSFVIPESASSPFTLSLRGEQFDVFDPAHVDNISGTYTKPCPTLTNTATSTPTETQTSTATDTPTSTATDTPTSTATDTPTSTATDIPPTSTDTPTETVIPSSTATDVPPTSTVTDVPVGTGLAVVTVVTSNGSPIPDDTEVCLANQCQSLDAIAAAAAPSGTSATFSDLAAGSYPLTVLIGGVDVYADTITIAADETIEITVVLPQGAATPSPVDPGETPAPPVISLPSTGSGTDPSWATYLVLLGGAALVSLAGALTWRQRRRL